MRSILPAFFAICIALTPVAAEADGKEEKVKRLMELVRVDDMLDRMMDAIAPGLEAQMQKIPNMKPEHAAELSEIFIEEFTSNSPDMVAEFTPIYADAFTEAELDDILAFYDTPTGKKTLAVLPEIQIKVALMSQKWGLAAAKAASDRIDAYLLEKGYKKK